MSDILKFLNSIFNPNKVKLNHNISKSSNYINRLTDLEDKKDKTLDLYDRYKDFHNDIYKTLIQIYKSISRHVRKKIIKKNKYWIRKFLNRQIEDKIIPNIYSYVMWRKNIEGLTNFWEVDYGKRKKFKVNYNIESA